MSEGDGILNRPGPASAAEPSMEEILASIRRILSEEEGAAKLAPDEEDELLLDASMRVPAQEFPASATEPPEHEPMLSPAVQEQSAFLHFAQEATLESPPAPEPAPEPITFAPEPVQGQAFEPFAEPAPFVPPEPAFAPEPVVEPAAYEPPAPEPLVTFAPLPPAEEPPAPVFTPIQEPGPVLGTWAAEPPQVEPALPPEPEQEKEQIMEEHVQGPEGLVGDQAVSEIANSVGALVRSVSAERSASVGRAGITIEDIVREEVKPVLKAWLDTHLPSLVERVVRAEINRVMDRAQG